MEIGVCCSPDTAQKYLDAGFDYVELAAAPLARDPDALKGLGAPVTNVFFPGSISLYTPVPAYRAHAETVISRAAASGVQLMVLGSGASRRAPEGLSLEAAEHRFIAIAAELDGIARARGLRIVPESLTKDETNVGNDLPSLARALRDLGVGFTADAYHVLKEWERLPTSGREDPGQQRFWREQLPFAPSHVHFASLKGRVLEHNDPHLYAFFQRLRELDYDARASFEGDPSQWDPSEMLAAIRGLAERG